ncbi:hypothetical protein, partial [Paenibacillus ihuae]|uniref:hypothetical protein n=1 Tax=Paenibacillus ihuae TaxID=1232431 RepID=UPI00131EA2BA
GFCEVAHESSVQQSSFFIFAADVWQQSSTEELSAEQQLSFTTTLGTCLIDTANSFLNFGFCEEEYVLSKLHSSFSTDIAEDWQQESPADSTFEQQSSFAVPIVVSFLYSIRPQPLPSAEKQA